MSAKLDLNLMCYRGSKVTPTTPPDSDKHHFGYPIKEYSLLSYVCCNCSYTKINHPVTFGGCTPDPCYRELLLYLELLSENNGTTPEVYPCLS